jgi:hypothetical protein
MKWLLIALILWTSGPPRVIKIPVATKEQCEQAVKQVRMDFGESAATNAGVPPQLKSPPAYNGVLVSCVKVSN